MRPQSMLHGAITVPRPICLHPARVRHQQACFPQIALRSRLLEPSRARLNRHRKGMLRRLHSRQMQSHLSRRPHRRRSLRKPFPRLHCNLDQTLGHLQAMGSGKTAQSRIFFTCQMMLSVRRYCSHGGYQSRVDNRWTQLSTRTQNLYKVLRGGIRSLLRRRLVLPTRRKHFGCLRSLSSASHKFDVSGIAKSLSLVPLIQSSYMRSSSSCHQNQPLHPSTGGRSKDLN
jgi:hypothetical protein